MKIDKFGRVLIPKKIREAKGYVCGTELSLVMEPGVEALSLKPKAEEERPYFKMTEWGLPVIVYPDGWPKSKSAVEMIAEDREERSLITSGYFRSLENENKGEE